MSADTLRRAAALMRERAEAAPSGPWLPMRYGRVGRAMQGGGIIDMVADTFPRGGSAAQQSNAEHVASWHPAVALAVADWMDAEATVMGFRPDLDWSHNKSLAVARAYLGEDQ